MRVLVPVKPLLVVIVQAGWYSEAVVDEPCVHGSLDRVKREYQVVFAIGSSPRSASAAAWLEIDDSKFLQEGTEANTWTFTEENEGNEGQKGI